MYTRRKDKDDDDEGGEAREEEIFSWPHFLESFKYMAPSRLRLVLSIIDERTAVASLIHTTCLY